VGGECLMLHWPVFVRRNRPCLPRGDLWRGVGVGNFFCDSTFYTDLPLLCSTGNSPLLAMETFRARRAMPNFFNLELLKFIKNLKKANGMIRRNHWEHSAGFFPLAGGPSLRLVAVERRGIAGALIEPFCPRRNGLRSAALENLSCAFSPGRKR